MDHPGRLALLARALPAIGLSRSADSRWPLEVGQAGRAGIFGIIWRVLSAYRYLERSREPGRQLARPMEFSRTRTTSRPTRALQTSEKCARFKENEGHANVDPRQGIGVNVTIVRCTNIVTSPIVFLQPLVLVRSTVLISEA